MILQALEYFKAAAEKGNAEAQFNLGAMYVGGMGVKKAHDKARPPSLHTHPAAVQAFGCRAASPSLHP